jgi:HAD superfamily hydrolase (TIGR01509 family)
MIVEQRKQVHSRMTHAQPNVHDVKAVTFDLWETLLFEKDGASAQRTAARCRNLAQALTKLGMNTSVEQVNHALNKTIKLLLNVWNENKDLTHTDQLQSIIRQVSKDRAKINEKWLPELSKAYISPLYEVPPYLNPDAPQVLQWLQKKRKKIGLVCNTGITPGFELREFLSKIGASQYFDVMIFSDEVGIRKPDPRIFYLAARKLEAKPHETVHIGDNLKSDVWGAKSAGFKAIYLSADEGRDKTAEKDPKSLAELSRRLGKLQGKQTSPDKKINTLALAIKAITELQRTTTGARSMC